VGIQGVKARHLATVVGITIDMHSYVILLCIGGTDDDMEVALRILSGLLTLLFACLCLWQGHRLYSDLGDQYVTKKSRETLWPAGGQTTLNSTSSTTRGVLKADGSLLADRTLSGTCKNL